MNGLSLITSKYIPQKSGQVDILIVTVNLSNELPEKFLISGNLVKKYLRGVTITPLSVFLWFGFHLFQNKYSSITLLLCFIMFLY
ncbi:hypothetical protein XBJ2_2080017 [Xenorhabdus bovienii str. Jollieti]|uniref:Uncharacterized protein n=1 Tax=Xenorhabdus bovienii (strain SS-2004) TaxID=406818 RepID=D3V6E6_XENBS|nr:hypothetical protein XBJ1_4113 [Xenorhabdus bovienii SS-2004]CDH28937.1 hypothetical protein XBJ2_2080017 [Xenorhabdus bovienii str. Jollieti]